MSSDRPHHNEDDRLIERLDAWGVDEISSAEARLTPLRLHRDGAERTLTLRAAGPARSSVIRRVGALVSAASMIAIAGALIWFTAVRQGPTPASDPADIADANAAAAPDDLFPTVYALLRINQNRSADDLILPERFDISWASRTAPLISNESVRQ